MPNKYHRICIQRCGYAIVPGDTPKESLANAGKLKEHDIDWEPFSPALMDDAEVVESCGPNGEPIS